MARKPPPQAIPLPAQLSPEQMRQAIPRLEKRIAELAQLNLNSLTEENGDDVLCGHVNKINDTLIGIYGHNSIEYNRYAVDGLSFYSMALFAGYDRSFRARLPDITKAVMSLLSNLKSALDILKEKVGEVDAPAAGNSIRAYQGLDLHSEISRAASRLYTDGHYANAVEAAVKALNGLVRLRSGLEIDGTSLMEKAFSPNAPVLKFNDLASQSDKDEQKGFMQMFSGAVSGLRNPRAHGFLKDDPERALEFIAFVSLLAKLLDEAST
ncbi:TIGR02391 family protein [Magnetospirillum sp. 15-1]|uniref:TIGR02391 family protein n=1 Tax=Magnetospirillum sp. 15-1 TaxID=1979370 RepID=UPI0011415B21|nr:TIGR02391 family protein [Magnetospirillum sp. 15-1]